MSCQEKIFICSPELAIVTSSYNYTLWMLMHKSMKSSTSPQPGKWRGKPGTMASLTFASLSYWEYACCRCLGKLVGEHHGIRTSLLTTAILKTERRPLERLTGQHGSFVLGQYFFNSPTVETANCLTRMLDQNKLIRSN